MAWLVHPNPFTHTPQLCHLALSHPKLLHHARFHLLHTTSTTKFRCPPPRLPPALSHLSSARMKRKRERTIQKLARPTFPNFSPPFRGGKLRNGRGGRGGRGGGGREGGSLHLDTSKVEVFVLFPLPFWWWNVFRNHKVDLVGFFTLLENKKNWGAMCALHQLWTPVKLSVADLLLKSALSTTAW